jgi:hypothetical protein
VTPGLEGGAGQDTDARADAAPGVPAGRLRGLPIRRLGGFLGLPLISAVAPFLVLPVLLSRVGTAAWVAIAVGQSVGTGAATVVLLGWPIVGPALVAEEPQRQRALYTRSVVSRVSVLVLAAPIAMGIAAVLAPAQERGAAAAMALASSLTGLSASWFFVGTGHPGAIARWDTVPKVLATGLAALLVLLLRWTWLYPAVLAVTFAGLFLAVSARYWEHAPLSPYRTTVDVVRDQWTAAGASAQAAVNATLPLALLAAVAPSAVAGFAAIERIAKFTTFVLAPVGQAFQGWVAEPAPDQARRRRTALVVTVTAGVLLAAGFLLAAGLLLKLLFASRIEVPHLAIVFEAGAIVGVAFGLTLGFHHLVPLRMTGWLASSTAVGIVVAGAGVLLLAPALGVTGAALSILLAEAAVVATQAIGLAARRSRKT